MSPRVAFTVPVLLAVIVLRHVTVMPTPRRVSLWPLGRHVWEHPRAGGWIRQRPRLVPE
jgi:hypothetical protein